MYRPRFLHNPVVSPEDDDLKSLISALMHKDYPNMEFDSIKIDYKNAHRYINKLYKENLILLDRKESIQGKKVYATLSEKTLGLILDELEATMLG